MSYVTLRLAGSIAALFLVIGPSMAYALDESPERPATAMAAAASGPEVGSRVRVTASSPAFTGAVIGTLISLDAEKVIVLDSKSGSVSELPLDSVRRLEVSRPRHRGRTGALIGIGLGIGAGALAGSGYSEVGCGERGGPYVKCQAATGGEVIALGAFAGAMYGGLGYWLGKRSKVDVWSDAPAGGLKVSLQPLRKGGSVAFTFSF